MNPLPKLLSAALLAALFSGACASKQPAHTKATPRFAIAIHGGAGVLSKAVTTPQQRAEYTNSLRQALTLGRDTLATGGTAFDACEKVVRFLEDDPRFNAGKGAVFTEDGGHELDAAIMDGNGRRAGAVAGVRTVKNPISLARQAMDKTRHILLAGQGAESFADTMNAERVPNSYFDTDYRRKVLNEVLEERRQQEQSKPAAAVAAEDSTYRGTVGCVALDTSGNLAAATSTGGLTAKKWGRIGDSPLIGAGTYADNATCAVSGTGTGEQFIRHTVARTISALIEYKGYSAQRAAEEVVHHRLNPDDGGVIVVSANGDIAMVYSTEGMYRGAADSSGRFDVAIYEGNEP